MDFDQSAVRRTRTQRVTTTAKLFEGRGRPQLNHFALRKMLMMRKINTVISRNGRLLGLSVFLGTAMLALCVQKLSASDDDIVNAKGFEPGSPPNGFSTTFLGTGQLEGQINPPGSGQLISPGQWLRTKGTGTSTAFV